VGGSGKVDLLFVSTSGVDQDLFICEDKKKQPPLPNTTQKLVLLKSIF
jgi:hypothetical protein